MREDQQLTMARFARFNAFMQEVQAASPEEYSDIPAIEHRFSTLQAAISSAESEMAQQKAEMAAETARLGRLRGDLERYKIDLQNDFDLLKQQYDLTKERSDEMLRAADSASSDKGQKLKVFGQVLQTVQHQFNRCTGSSHQHIIKHRPRAIPDADLVANRCRLVDRKQRLERAAAAVAAAEATPITALVGGGAGVGSTAPSHGRRRGGKGRASKAGRAAPSATQPPAAATLAGGQAGPGSSPSRGSPPAADAGSAVLQELLDLGRRHARGTGGGLSEEELERLEAFTHLKADVVQAMQQLEVVGAYLVDLQRIVGDWEGGERDTWAQGRREGAATGAAPLAAHAGAGTDPPLPPHAGAPPPGAALSHGSGRAGAASLSRSGARGGRGDASDSRRQGGAPARGGSGTQEWRLRPQAGVGDSSGGFVSGTSAGVSGSSSALRR